MEELVISGLNLFILCFAIGYFLWPRAEAKLQARRQGIADDLSGAKQHREAAIQEAAVYAQKLEQFDTEREYLMAAAEEQAQARAARMIEAAQIQAEVIAQRAYREAELVQMKLKDEARREMVVLAASAAAKLIADSMDGQALNETITETLKGMGEITWQG